MMPSTNPSSSATHVFPPSNSFLGHEKDNLYINPSLSYDSFQAREKTTTRKQDLVEGLGLEKCDTNDHLFWSVVKKNKAFDKDHHSKIHTAQGTRDRRVRLSIEVAERFFYLQDLLGFDKGSKTLEWLFNKAKNSIDELIKRKKESSSSALTHQSEVVFLETDEEAKLGRKKKCVEEKRKKIRRKYTSGFIVNQSRADARARARERTKEKLNVKKLDKESKNPHVDSCSSKLTLQPSLWSSVESQNNYSDKIGEAIMEDNIPKLYSYQHNLAMSNDSSSEFTWCNHLDPLEVLISQKAAIKY